MQWPLKDLIDSQDSEGSIGLLRVLWISKKGGAKENVEIPKESWESEVTSKDIIGIFGPYGPHCGCI